MQYTALAYANPVRLIYAVIIPSHVVVSPPRAAVGDPGETPYRQEVLEPFERRLYEPIRLVVARMAGAVKVMQSGDINQYVAYIFGIVLLVLLLRVI